MFIIAQYVLFHYNSTCFEGRIAKAIMKSTYQVVHRWACLAHEYKKGANGKDGGADNVEDEAAAFAA